MAVVMTLWHSKVIKIIAGFLFSMLLLNALVRNGVDYTATRHMVRGGHSGWADDSLYQAIQNETLGVRHLKLLYVVLSNVSSSSMSMPLVSRSVPTSAISWLWPPRLSAFKWTG
jgi:hypothetical protein